MGWVQEHTVSLRTTPKTDVDLKLLATLLSREDYERVVAYKVSHTVAVKSEPLAQPERPICGDSDHRHTGPCELYAKPAGPCDCAGILYGDGQHDDFCASRKGV